jgi:hypothetical protein
MVEEGEYLLFVVHNAVIDDKLVVGRAVGHRIITGGWSTAVVRRGPDADELVQELTVFEYDVVVRAGHLVLPGVGSQSLW